MVTIMIVMKAIIEIAMMVRIIILVIVTIVITVAQEPRLQHQNFEGRRLEDVKIFSSLWTTQVATASM